MYFSIWTTVSLLFPHPVFLCMDMRSVQKISSHVIWKIETSVEEDTLLSPLQRRHLGTSHSSPNHHQLPCHIFLNLNDGLKSPLFQRSFKFWEKPEVTRHQNWAVSGAESPGWFDVLPKPCTRHDAWVGMLLWWSCQSPVAHSCGLLNHPNSFHRGMFKLNAKFDAVSLLYLLSHFECKATQYTCSLNGIYCFHWLIQWSHHCSCMCIPAHPPWMPGYIDVMKTILIILTMAGLFPDKPRIGFFPTPLLTDLFYTVTVHN